MTPTEKLQAEAEQLYPYPKNSEPWWLAIIDVKRAAHVACAEKYTAIIDQLKQKHEERILILALDMQKKDQEIARLRNALEKSLEWIADVGQREVSLEDKKGMALYHIRWLAKNVLENQIPTP